MTIYVDDMRMAATVGRVTARWSHLFSDTGTPELEDFAERLGLNPEWIQDSHGFIHYDVVDSKREQAIKLGARTIPYIELAKYVRNSYMKDSIPPE